MLPKQLREKLFRTIRDSFAQGKSAVYYEALFWAFSEEFLDYHIYDAEMLKAYLAFYNNGEFYMSSKYISKDAVTDVDPSEEIAVLCGFAMNFDMSPARILIHKSKSYGIRSNLLKIKSLLLFALPRTIMRVLPSGRRFEMR